MAKLGKGQGLCDNCQLGGKVAGMYVCDVGNYPRLHKLYCKYHRSPKAIPAAGVGKSDAEVRHRFLKREGVKSGRV